MFRAFRYLHCVSSEDENIWNDWNYGNQWNVPGLFRKSAELVSFNHGAVLSVKFDTIVEVLVHD